jgi:hypothetical protein
VFWNFDYFEQTCDFRIHVTREWEIELKALRIGSSPGPRGATLATRNFSTYSYIDPSGDVIAAALRSEQDLRGKLCRKSVYVKQKCCVRYDNWWTWITAGPYSEDEDRYVKVHLYGKTFIPKNSIPVGLECDVSAAEGQLNSAITSLNSLKHDMCTQKLSVLNKSSNTTFLVAEDSLLDSLPDGTVKYHKGHHDPLRLFLGPDYRAWYLNRSS